MQDTKATGRRGRSSDPSIEVYWPRRGVAQIVLIGEHDLASSPALDSTIDETLDGGSSRVVIDLTVAEFIDSTVIRTLVRTHRRAQEAGVGFCLVVGADSIARKALEITDVYVTLNAAETLEDALQLVEIGGNGSSPAMTRE